MVRPGLLCMTMENNLHPNASNISLCIITSERDKRIPNFYPPQMQGKIEAYTKIVRNEFLALEDVPNIDDGKLRYDRFVKAYNDTREHGGINGLNQLEMFLQRLITSTIHTKTKQHGVTHVGN